MTLAYDYNQTTLPRFDPAVIAPARIVDIGAFFYARLKLVRQKR